MKNTLLALALVFPALACSGSESQSTANPTDPDAAVEVSMAEHAVNCGCRNEEIGQCGNYVVIDDEWLEISNPADHDLSKMEWCSEPGPVAATVAGTRTGGEIELTTLEVAEN